MNDKVLKIGDIVNANTASVRRPRTKEWIKSNEIKLPFKIETIHNCNFISGCRFKYPSCPGEINGRCFGIDGMFILEKLTDWDE